MSLSHQTGIWFCRNTIRSPGMDNCFIIIFFPISTSRLNPREINYYAELEYSRHSSALWNESLCLDLDHEKVHWEKLDEYKGSRKTNVNRRCDQKKKWTDPQQQFQLQLPNRVFGVCFAPAHWQGQHRVQKELWLSAPQQAIQQLSDPSRPAALIKAHPRYSRWKNTPAKVFQLLFNFWAVTNSLLINYRSKTQQTFCISGK